MRRNLEKDYVVVMPQIVCRMNEQVERRFINFLGGNKFFIFKKLTFLESTEVLDIGGDSESEVNTPRVLVDAELPLDTRERSNLEK